jgi:hypothetical protein
MKLEVVTDASGLPLGMATAGANVSEQALLVPALGDIPVAVPDGTPVIADKGHDSDPLRDDVEAEGFVPVIPQLHRIVQRQERRWWNSPAFPGHPERVSNPSGCTDLRQIRVTGCTPGCTRDETSGGGVRDGRAPPPLR